VVEVAAVVEGAEAAVVEVMVPTHLAGKGTTIGVANHGIGPMIIEVSSPRRIKRSRLSRPRRRSQLSSSPRLNLWCHR
jgi:hypothetical protein